MNKLLGLGIGLAVGVAVGAAAAILLSPQSGLELRGNLKTSYREALDEARKAGQERRAQLEAELAGMPRVPPRKTS
ncbi:MAG: YtxH domain-containing protein [Anaerolineae bacterium]